MIAALLLAGLLSVDQMREDLQQTRAALEESHAGIYRYTTKQELDQVFRDAQASLAHPMDPLAFQRILAPAVAAIRCGHTAVQLSPEQRKEVEQAPLLPLDVKLIDGKVLIATPGRLAGREITSVNGVPAPRIVKTLMAASPGDGFIETGRARRVGRRFAEELLTGLDIRGPEFMLGLRGSRQAVRVTGQAKLAQVRRPLRFADLSFVDDGRVAYYKVNTFMDDDEDDNGETLLEQAFEKIAASGARTLLLDLRDNAGGKDELGKLLFAHLVDQPFRYYQELTVKSPSGMTALGAHPNLGWQTPAKPAFRGKVIALINGGSFSTTAELISQLHDKRRAVFVGEESGGAYHGNTSGRDRVLVLPNSQLRVAIALVSYRLALDGQHPNGRGVVPHVLVTPSIGDLLAGRDPQLARALQMARQAAILPKKAPRRWPAPSASARTLRRQ